MKCRRTGWEDAYLDYRKLKDTLAELERYLEERNANRISCKAAFDIAPESLSNVVDDSVENNGSQRQQSLSLEHAASVELGEQLAQGIDNIKQRFFQELRREVEKMSLFALKTQGTISDAVGTLRFEDDGEIEALFSMDESVFFLNMNSRNLDSLERYLSVGVELLYVLQYIGVNTLGVRKILKKYNKIIQKLDDPQYAYLFGSQDDIHLHQLANSKSVVAIEASLQSALVQFYYTDDTFDIDPQRNLNYFRFQSIILASRMIRKNSEIVNAPFRDFLGRKAMINLGDIEGTAMLAVDSLLTFDPKALLTQDMETLDRLWTAWLPEYAYWKKRREAQMENWSRLSNPAKAVMAILQSQEKYWDVLDKQDVFGEEAYQENVRRKSWGGVDMVSMVLNLTSILLYTINYYIVAPTANHYALLLGMDGAYGATLIGASSFAAIYAAFLYSFWYTRTSFRSALIFSAICPLIGNLIYALAISYDSMGMALAGRIMCGFGSAEVVNRQLISTCVSYQHMTRASALFVAFGALGMSIGPLIAAVLDTTVGRDLKIDLYLPFTPARGIIYNHVTSPGFLMATFWFVEMFALVLFFQEPDRINAYEAAEYSDDEEEGDLGNETIPLKTNGYGSIQNKRSSLNDSVMSSTSLRKPKPTGIWSELCLTWSLFFMKPGLCVTLLLFCFIELADEVIITAF
jgi:MFS family permease